MLSVWLHLGYTWGHKNVMFAPDDPIERAWDVSLKICKFSLGFSGVKNLKKNNVIT